MSNQGPHLGLMQHLENMGNKVVELAGERINDCIMALGAFLDKLTENVTAMGHSSGVSMGGIGAKLNPANWFRQNTSPDPTPSQGEKVGKSAEKMRQMEMPVMQKSELSLPSRALQMVDMSKAQGGYGFAVTDVSTGHAVSPSSGIGSWNRYHAQQAGVGI